MPGKSLCQLQRSFPGGLDAAGITTNPPNAVCKQVNNPMSTSKLAARLHSKTLQFSEELRHFTNVKLLWVSRRKSTRDEESWSTSWGLYFRSHDVKQTNFFTYLLFQVITNLVKWAARSKKASLVFIQGIWGGQGLFQWWHEHPVLTSRGYDSCYSSFHLPQGHKPFK